MSYDIYWKAVQRSNFFCYTFVSFVFPSEIKFKGQKCNILIFFNDVCNFLKDAVSLSCWCLETIKFSICVTLMSVHAVDWLIDWLWSIDSDWSIDWLIDWLVGVAPVSKEVGFHSRIFINQQVPGAIETHSTANDVYTERWLWKYDSSCSSIRPLRRKW